MVLDRHRFLCFIFKDVKKKKKKKAPIVIKCEKGPKETINPSLQSRSKHSLGTLIISYCVMIHGDTGPFFSVG